MKTIKRPTLGIRNKGLIDPDNDRPLELGVYDVLLPCRKFSISHKVAEVGRVSLTTEFLVRLLKSIDGMKEDDVASFFGYDLREISFVLSEAETNDFVNRKDGRIYLTAVGQGLFKPGSEYPEIFEVDSRQEMVGFDLIALAPEERPYLSAFERRLPELHLVDAEKVSAATRLIPSAFRKFYWEIVSRRDPTATLKRSLYSIDDVVAKDRFSSTVRISVQSTGLRPSVAEPVMSDWRPEHEQEDRTKIIEAASRFVDELKVHSRPDDGETYQILLDLAPNFLKEFTRRDGLAVERYYRDAFSRAGDIRSDRPTTPLLGSLFTRENSRRLSEVAKYGIRSDMKPAELCIWFVPQVPHWGVTKALPEILKHLKANTLSASDVDDECSSNRTIGMVAGWAPKHIEAAFDIVGTSHASRVSPSLEMLLVPNVLVAVTVNTPIGSISGHPVPIGLVSFDVQVISRAQRFILENIEYYGLSKDLIDEIRSVLLIESAGPQ
ncbi:hypothetical protein MNBD_GAMMA13-308 [hydrothermal vent metagenome]|uniref:Uncharacterized protein n=1 Tax=hydrothermal vent metagenome TaxID=652676 RepID=A0A3B0YEP3_9ZZZZ